MFRFAGTFVGLRFFKSHTQSNAQLIGANANKTERGDSTDYENGDDELANET